MNYTFGDYEDLILTRLASLKAPGGALSELKGFAGEIVPTEGGVLLVLLNRFPAVLVEIPEVACEPGSNPYWREMATVLLHVCSRSLRSQEEARGGERGAYPILADIRKLLLGYQLAADLQPLALDRVSRNAAGLTEQNEYLMVYQMRFTFVNPRIKQEA